jgi:hypothetical protein
MQIWDRHPTSEILKTLEMELAKAKNELRCAKNDVEKTTNRVNFMLSAVHHLQNKKDMKI